MNSIYIFGNPLLDFDNLPIKLAPELKKIFPQIDFVVMDPNENLRPENKELIIIDTAINVNGTSNATPLRQGYEGVISSPSANDNKVKILEDIDKIELSPSFSAHDYDLGFNLKLLKKLGQLEKITIFCVPPDIDKKQALTELVDLIREKKNSRQRA